MRERDFNNEYSLDILANGVVHIVFKDGSSMHGEDVNLLHERYKEVNPGHKVKVLSDIRGLRSVDMKTRKFVSDPIAEELVESLAIIVSNSVSRVIGSFILGLNKPKFPVKLVADEEQGFKFLNVHSHESVK
ncbi:DUF7793 family protein [Sanyastnella coralliicola]|uniref:DUF7793 family protein n=1 Tax=Sanyastnella coralliicola TaxID=3069118 RepID=UPI0027BAF407|nr:hypothetical protein [Longitalea sp. SCSIO 12813]